MLFARRLEILKLKNDLENLPLTPAQRRETEEAIAVQREAIEELKQELIIPSEDNIPDLRAQRFAR